jgi:hypothetical protein
VYFLFGSSEKDFVYVGQARARKNKEGILLRLKEHKGEKDKEKIGDWSEAVVFTTSDNSFDLTEISYLENRFYRLAKDAKRYELKNGNEPNPGNVGKVKKSALNKFIKEARLMMGVLGFKVFEPLPVPSTSKQETPASAGESEEVLKLVKGKLISAKGVRTNNGFVVLKGSYIKLKVTQSCPKAAKEKREIHKSDISHSGEIGILTKDIQCESPNIAASFVTGYSINARQAWKTADGKTLNDLENS